MPALDFDIWVTRHRRLEKMVRRHVGFPVASCCAKSSDTGAGDRFSYCFVPFTRGREELHAFWDWHLKHGRPYFVTPLEAAAHFVKRWRSWMAAR